MSEGNIYANLSAKLAVLDAMTKLVHECPYDEIKIKDICDVAYISKATFYRLFESKYDIATWILRLYSEIGLDEIGRTLTWHEGLSVSVYGLHSYRDFLKAANETKFNDSAPAFVTFEHRKESLIETIECYKGIAVQGRLLFQVETWAKLSTYIASLWHSNRLPYSPEEYMDYLESVIPRQLFEILNSPVSPKPMKILNSDVDGILKTTYLHEYVLNRGFARTGGTLRF